MLRQQRGIDDDDDRGNTLHQPPAQTVMRADDNSIHHSSTHPRIAVKTRLTPRTAALVARVVWSSMP